MKIQPISPMFKRNNDTRRDAPPLTEERVIEHIKLMKELDGEDSTSTIVNLSTDVLPAFLYNKDGKIK